MIQEEGKETGEGREKKRRREELGRSKERKRKEGEKIRRTRVVCSSGRREEEKLSEGDEISRNLKEKKDEKEKKRRREGEGSKGQKEEGRRMANGLFAPWWSVSTGSSMSVSRTGKSNSEETLTSPGTKGSVVGKVSENPEENGQCSVRGERKEILKKEGDG